MLGALSYYHGCVSGHTTEDQQFVGSLASSENEKKPKGNMEDYSCMHIVDCLAGEKQSML